MKGWRPRVCRREIKLETWNEFPMIHAQLVTWPGPQVPAGSLCCPLPSPSPPAPGKRSGMEGRPHSGSPPLGKLIGRNKHRTTRVPKVSEVSSSPYVHLSL